MTAELSPISKINFWLLGLRRCTRGSSGFRITALDV